VTSRAPVSPRIVRSSFSGSSIHPVRFAISHPAFGKAQDALTTEWGGRQSIRAATRLPPFTRSGSTRDGGNCDVIPK
jgi:hypothetical protein